MLKEVKKLQNTEIKNIIRNRLSEFQAKNKKGNREWFSELCFCILTANSRADTAMNIQRELGSYGFINFTEKRISYIIKKNKHRFHNNKAKFIVQARKFRNIKSVVKKLENNNENVREFIVKNIKGIGYKEASHFLRNVGYFNYAILDRHIINLLYENNYIKEKPKSLNKKIYLKIEKLFNKLASKLNMSCSELDLYMWYIKTNKVLK